MKRMSRQTIQRKVNQRIRILCVNGFLLTVLLASGVSQAQERRPDRGFQHANSYSISDIENVNLSNGNLMLNIPLASLPTGKGTSSGYTVALNYNSKLWNPSREFRTDGIGEGISGLHYARELVQPSEQGGWYLDSGGYQLNLVNRQGVEGEAPCIEATGEYEYRRNGYKFKLEMQLPNGSVKEFRPNYWDYYGDGYFNVDPFGVQYSYSYGWNPDLQRPTCSSSAVQVTTAGINYYTDDGSGLRLFLPYQPGQIFQLMRWTLYFPDGQILENRPLDDPSISQRLTDRNGNKVFWRPATLNGINGSKIEDEAGHFIFVGFNAGDYKIIQPGVDGELLETTFQYKETWVYHRYLTTNAPNVNPPYIYEDLYQSLGMVDKITLPVQAGGLEYRFTYHAADTAPTTGNYTEGYGELASITLPSGVKADYSYSLSGNDPGLESFHVVSSTVTGRELTYQRQYDGGTEQVTETTGYGAGSGIGGVYTPDGRSRTEVSAIGGDLNGYAYRITQTGGAMVEKIWVNKRPMGGSFYAKIDPFVKTEFTSVPDANGNPALTATRDFDYDQNGNVLEVREYEWVPYSSVPRSSTGAVNEFLPVPRLRDCLRVWS